MLFLKKTNEYNVNDEISQVSVIYVRLDDLTFNSCLCGIVLGSIAIGESQS